MALDWNITDCKEEHQPFIRQNLYNFGVLMMVTGTHAIHGEEDVRRFQYRLRLYTNATGNDWSELLEYAHRFKGIHTNVGQETDGEFKRRMVKLLTDRTEREHVKFLRLLSEPTSSV